MGIIEFTELRITPDSKYLVIEAKVRDEDYFKDVYIDSITVDNQDTYVSNGGSTTPLFHLELDEDVKYYRLRLNSAMLSASLDGIFFIKAKARGIPLEDTPCGCDGEYTTEVVMNAYPIYKQGMSYIRELENTCSIPSGFADFILKFNALELAIRTCNYTLASKYYNMFLKHYNRTRANNGGCGCGK